MTIHRPQGHPFKGTEGRTAAEVEAVPERSATVARASMGLDELVEHWTLLKDEQALVAGLRGLRLYSTARGPRQHLAWRDSRYLFNIKSSGHGHGLRPLRDPDTAESAGGEQP